MKGANPFILAQILPPEAADIGDGRSDDGARSRRAGTGRRVTDAGNGGRGRIKPDRRGRDRRRIGGTGRQGQAVDPARPEIALAGGDVHLQVIGAAVGIEARPGQTVVGQDSDEGNRNG